jgi:MaoC like domain
MSPRPVGEKAARTRTVRERDIELFTELTGDRNPLHYDEQAAARASGGLSSRAASPPVCLTPSSPRICRGRGVFLHDKPLTKLRTTITNQEGTIVLDGSALVWTEPL